MQGVGVVVIRCESDLDVAAIRAVNEAAFGQPFEADLVDALRREADPFISLVADRDGDVIGHICFSPVAIGNDERRGYVGLGPMAVRPGEQNRGVGSQLVTAGLAECRRRGLSLIVLVGHAAYYPRFGFQPASRFGLTCEYEVPDDVFMALRLDDSVPPAGRVRYHRAFGPPEAGPHE